jgi:hypothetical protein
MRSLNVEERIGFAVRFATTNLGQNREGDWLNLRDDLNQFLGAGPDDEINVKLSKGVYITADPDTEGISGVAASEADVRAIQADVQQLLTGFAGPARTTGRFPKGLKAVPIALDYRVARIRHPERRQNGSSVVVASGNLRDCVLAVLLHLLVQQPGSPVELCPECQKVFYRQGKQVFCSRQCTNRAMTKRKRERDREKELTRRANSRGKRRRSPKTAS